MYTFDVSNCHNYFAGDILVHNGLTLTIAMEVQGEFKKIRFGVESSDIIESVKLKIQKEEGIHVQFQTLKPQIVMTNEDDKPLEDYNIYKDATIRLEINRSREKK